MKKYISEEMKNPENLLSNKIECRCECANVIGLIPLNEAKSFINNGFGYILSTDTIVEFDCTCPVKYKEEKPKIQYKYVQINGKRYKINNQIWVFEKPFDDNNDVRVVLYNNNRMMLDIIEGSFNQIKKYIFEKTNIFIQFRK